MFCTWQVLPQPKLATCAGIVVLCASWGLQHLCELVAHVEHPLLIPCLTNEPVVRVEAASVINARQGYAADMMVPPAALLLPLTASPTEPWG
jgi:hypothetical protein